MKLRDEHLQFLIRLANGQHPGIADNAADKVRQFCRRNGLAECVMNPRRWVITEAGRNALKEKP
ncbi:hypothetical protein [Agrobacterium sp. MS2]|uniref:hypothetical protein n=1 Tax=Agrobacterium sp. MS2 TaxID=1345498 RepID=UPI000DBF6D03|nr:hypothetical protein [Agrobacterium sp. MS2]RAL98687.1 hypothetical protein DOU54_06405 [Agrobacterium sp. MS2]